MDPQVQTSFIPKQALANQARGGGMGLFFLLALLVFAMSLLAAGAAFGYTQVLDNRITSKDKDLREAEGAFDAASIQELLRLDTRMIQTKNLLDSHVSPSAVFGFLSQITLQRVQYNSFDLQIQPDGGASVALGGVADSFQSVALQSDQYSASKVLRDVIISGFGVADSGKVNFTVNATVDPSVLQYRKQLQLSTQ